MSSWFNSNQPQPPPRGSPQPPPPGQSYSRVPQASQRPPAAGQVAYNQPPRGQAQYEARDSVYDGVSYEKQPPSRGAGGGGGQRRSSRFQVVEAPSTEHALTNCLIVNPHDWQGTKYVTLKGHYVFTIKSDPKIESGTVGAAKLIRQWAQLSSTGDEVEVVPFSVGPAQNSTLTSLDLEVGFWFERNAPTDGQPFDADQMSQVFSRAYEGLAFTIGQPLVFDFNGHNLKATVKGLQRSDCEPRISLGVLNGGVTEINFIKASGSVIKIKSSAKKAPPNAILAPNFKFEDMGIGGLDNEFSAIFRRAFASRIFPPGLVEKLGIQHVKGIMLHGPPGTGKTLMARQIGKMLNAREPKVVNGPEVLNKFVGQSEENIRKLFEDAEKEMKEKGDESGLHIIIFDEIDAICKQRGSTNSGTGVGDSVVNQLLSKLDGVDQLNNILVIGMTNRLDMIDEALLRSGRLEVHIEISLPDEAGRVQILAIQTAKMKTNGVMASDVNLAELANLTKNFSGAELAGLVKSATSFAFNRHVKVGTVAGVSDDVEQMKVSRQDFMNALDEVQPAFGVSEEELQAVVHNGIFHFSPHIDEILRDGRLFVEQVRTSQRTPLVSVLLHGPPGSGKTALAATIALASEFPFIKLISPEAMVGYTEASKVQFITKVFLDSYKSPFSVIVVDGIERILDWVPIGPRFSNSVLQALMVLLRKRPPKGRRLLILSTTSNRSMLNDMDVADAFSADIRVPPVNDLTQIDHILKEVNLFSSSREHQRMMGMLQQAGFGNQDAFMIGIKKLLSLTEMAAQDREGAANKLMSTLMDSLTLA